MLPIFVVDAFTTEKFAGNPAAICPLSKPISDELQQKLAIEMNLSETAFILEKDGNFKTGRRFGLRWFTPTKEIGLCGHATLASAKVLFDICENVNETIEFETKNCSLFCKKLANGEIQMDFPTYKIQSIGQNEVMKKIVQVAAGNLPVKDVVIAVQENAQNIPKKLTVIIENTVTRSELESHKVNTSALFDCDPDGEHVQCVLITLQGTAENGCVDSNGKIYDFCSRSFFPWTGVPEDPVCGSAHCALGPYWAEKLGKNQLYARQCSKRGGELNITVRNDDRVNLSGFSVIVLRGEIDI